MDTVDANVHLGLPIDARDYAVAAHIVRDCGARAVRLLTNNPAKLEAVRTAHLDVVEHVPLRVTPVSERQRAYLHAKRERMGHLLEQV